MGEIRPLDQVHAPRPRTFAMLGNHLPRRCGIATFTTDLTQAIEDATGTPTVVVAMNDVGQAHAYPSRVRFEIAEGDIAAYRRAADFLNVNNIDILSLQHEYGIYGGKAGGHVLELVRALHIPVVTTLHTVLETPNPTQRDVMDSLLALSDRIVVMSADGKRILDKVHGIPVDKIDIIPHGILVGPERQHKHLGGIDERPVILTFGLLSPDKGIEYVIDAMPAILERHPNAVYIVLGATHPHVKLQHGEAYRHMLQARAERLGVDGNVIFHNRFVSQEELIEFLSAADIYITPYLKEEQSTSGTLAYAVGCGKAVISTPYRYARELLADGRGLLVPWRDSAAIGREVTSLLDHPELRTDIQTRAATFGKSMTWPTVAKEYIKTFTLATASHDARRRTGVNTRTIGKRRPELPELDLAHVALMTDDTGMLQHATFDLPRYQDGYCVDDNARALLLMTYFEEEGTEKPSTVRSLATRYLAFINHAFDESSGRFRNFMTYSRQWQPERGSDDSHGRTLWSLGAVIGRTTDPGRRGLATQLFHRALPAASELTSPRGWAYTLLGVDHYLHAFAGDSAVEAIRRNLTKRLMTRLHESQRADFPWFEDRLTYCNARLPQALIVSGARMGDADMIAEAARSLEWLAELQVQRGVFSPIGTNGFYVRGGPRAEFDQQPVEACAMISACLDAQRVTGNTRWLEHARRAFQWFFGQNVLDRPVYDARTGGCRDGIHTDRMNENQGAESTLSFLTALAEMRAYDRLVAERSRPVAVAVPISENILNHLPPPPHTRGDSTKIVSHTP